MKIGKPLDAAPALPPNSRPGTGAAGVARGQSPATPGVAVSVSSPTRSLGQASAPEINLSKVEAIRQAIAEGRFAVSAEAIADKLLANAQEMLDRTRV